MVELPELSVVGVDPSGADGMLVVATMPEELDEPEKLDDDFTEATKLVEPEDVELVTVPL